MAHEFDVVFAGELIENPGPAPVPTDSVRGHPVPRGQLTLTTQAPLALSCVIFRVRRDILVNNAHAYWFRECAVPQLAAQSDRDAESLSYFGHPTSHRYWHLFASVPPPPLLNRLPFGTVLAVAAPRQVSVRRKRDKSETRRAKTTGRTVSRYSSTALRRSGVRARPARLACSLRIPSWSHEFPVATRTPGQLTPRSDAGMERPLRDHVRSTTKSGPAGGGEPPIIPAVHGRLATHMGTK